MVLITPQYIKLCAKKIMHQHLHGIYKNFTTELGSFISLFFYYWWADGNFTMELPSNRDVAISIISCRMWGSHSGSYEEIYLLRYLAV
jgi:hypothetical protein